MVDEETKQKALARLSRIEGQVQGVQRMVENGKYCVDILLQLSVIQGAVEQGRKMLLGRHIELCVTEAMSPGGRRIVRRLRSFWGSSRATAGSV